MDKPVLIPLIGVPFLNGGRNLTDGMDCWGLVMHVFECYGITLPDFKIGASNLQDIDITAHEAIGFAPWEEIRDPTRGDVPLVVLMRIHPEYITHAGVYIDGDRIIHTMAKPGVIVSKRAEVKGMITGFYHYVDNN